jgi:hypothetical protein
MHTRPGECFAVVVKAGILFLFEGPPSTKSDGGSPFVLPLLKHIAWGERQTTKGREERKGLKAGNAQQNFKVRVHFANSTLAYTFKALRLVSKI